MLKNEDVFFAQQDPEKVVDEFNLLRDALSGDIHFSITPAAVSNPATANAWTRTVDIKLVNSDGKVHDWFNGDISASIADTSTAGTATITDTTPTMTNGECSVVVSGSAAAWLGGTRQVETATVVGTVTASGNATVVVTSAILTGSPKTYSVPVVVGDTALTIAQKIRVALAADSVLAAKYAVSGTGANIVLTVKVVAANDSTLNIAISNGTCTGITTAATSTNTTAGVASTETDTLTIANLTVLGYTVVGVTSVETFITGA